MKIYACPISRGLMGYVRTRSQALTEKNARPTRPFVRLLYLQKRWNLEQRKTLTLFYSLKNLSNTEVRCSVDFLDFVSSASAHSDPKCRLRLAEFS